MQIDANESSARMLHSGLLGLLLFWSPQSITCGVPECGYQTVVRHCSPHLMKLLSGGNKQAVLHVLLQEIQRLAKSVLNLLHKQTPAVTVLGYVTSCSKLQCQNRNRLFPGLALSWDDLWVCECVLTWQKNSHLKYLMWQLWKCAHHGLVTDRRSNKYPLQNDTFNTGVSSDSSSPSGLWTYHPLSFIAERWRCSFFHELEKQEIQDKK